MNLISFRSLGLLSVGLFLSLACARADDPVPPPPSPPAAPAAPETSPAGGAQPGGHRRGRGAYLLADLTAKLNLSAEQQKTVGGAIANARMQAKDARDDETLSKDDRRAKMRQIMTTAHDQIRAALSPDQQKLFDALPANVRRQAPPETN